GPGAGRTGGAPGRVRPGPRHPARRHPAGVAGLLRGRGRGGRGDAGAPEHVPVPAAAARRGGPDRPGRPRVPLRRHAAAAAVPRGVAGRRVTSVASASVGYWQVLHRRPGNRFLLGLAASGFGDSLVPLATAFAILHLTGSVALLGVAPGVSRVPALVVTLLGGVSEVPLVDDAARLAHRPLDLLRRDDVDPHGDPD